MKIITQSSSKEQTFRIFGMVGLGLGGAIAINLSGGLVLILWLIFGDLNIPFRGHFFLWSLAIILVVISSIELFIHLKKIA